jgi:uncharacterized protein
MNTRTATLNAPHVRATPWHRQPWPWLLMAGPAIVVVAGFATLYLAVRSDDGLVADDYYKKGLAINRTLERADRAAQLGLTAVVDVTADGRARVALATDSKEPDALPAALRVAVLHPTRAGHDIRGVVVRGPDGDYVGTLDALPPGRWRIVVETDAWRLPSAEVDGAVRGVHLPPPPVPPKQPTH